MTHTKQVKDLFGSDVESLSTITNFSFKIEKGYFSWQHHGFDSGTIPYSVDSKEFIAFQQEIASKCPKQFDELEGILL